MTTVSSQQSASEKTDRTNIVVTAANECHPAETAVRNTVQRLANRQRTGNGRLRLRDGVTVTNGKRNRKIM
jgi:hypothetical protein